MAVCISNTVKNAVGLAISPAHTDIARNVAIGMYGIIIASNQYQKDNMNDTLSWSVSQIWNDSLLRQNRRPIEPRDYIWASEMGGSMIDRYLKMQGVKPSNERDERSIRKFQAGNMTEWLICFVLKRAGILQNTQEYIKHQYPGMLKVTGRLDILAGGKPDWERAAAAVNDLDMPEFMATASRAIVDDLKTKYGQELKTIVIEVKSVASTMFDRYESTRKPAPNHAMQIYHYLVGKQMDEGHILYFSKDDCRMVEIPIHLATPYEDAYRRDIETITEYYNRKEQPPKEDEVVFNIERGKFAMNFKVEYSDYITMLYGYPHANDFRDKWKKRVDQWNRVLKRFVDGENITAGNLEVVKDIKTVFPNFEEIVETRKQIQPVEAEEESV